MWQVDFKITLLILERDVFGVIDTDIQTKTKILVDSCIFCECHDCSHT